MKVNSRKNRIKSSLQSKVNMKKRERDLIFPIRLTFAYLCFFIEAGTIYNNSHFCELTDDKFALLAQKQWPNIENLNLQDNEISNILNVLKKQKFSALSYLNLSRNKISNNDVGFLTSQFPKLKSLDLGFNYINFEGIYFLRQHSSLLLKILSLSGNNIGSKGIKILIKADLHLIEVLWLNECNIGQQGVKHIIKSRWVKLQKIGFMRNRVGLSSLLNVSNANWPHLSIIDSQTEIRVNIISFLAMMGTDWSKSTNIGTYLVMNKFTDDLEDIQSKRFNQF